jgi:hypothetical protein
MPFKRNCWMIWLRSLPWFWRRLRLPSAPRRCPSVDVAQLSGEEKVPTGPCRLQVAKTMTVYDRDALQTKLLDDLAPLLAGYSVDDAVAIILADNGFDNQVTLELRTNVIGAFADASSAIKTIESCIDVLSQSTTAQSKRRLTYHGISLAVSASSLALNVRSKVLFELLLNVRPLLIARLQQTSAPER